MMSDMLKVALLETDLLSFWAPHSILLLWVIFAGACVSQSKKERPWFIFHLARGIRLLKLQTLDQLRAMLLPFFYLDRMFKERLTKMWEEANAIAQAPGDCTLG